MKDKNLMSTKVDNLHGFMKRKRIINPKECQYDMKEELKYIFNAYHEAVKMYNVEIIMTPIESRARNFEASLFISKLLQCLGKVFGPDLKTGRYKRRFLYKNGYIVLFKKLNRKGMPMNIKTKLSESIQNQQEGNLFNEEEDGSSPILFFGYSKSKFGEIVHPKIIYIDEGVVKWQITEEDIVQMQTKENKPSLSPQQPTGGVTLKATSITKKKTE